ncbi:MAG: DOMON domain-containing protein [Candidatus Bipolaricaulota bacterium]|nr:DOMON domain-containing protein [Candidatus Bipolaricaulota bacterium]
MKSTVVSLVGVLALLGIGVGGALALRSVSVAPEASLLTASLAVSGLSGSMVGPQARTEVGPQTCTEGGPQTCTEGGAASAYGGPASAYGGPAAASAESAEPVADGLIYAREYRHWLYEPSTGMSLFWQNDATTLYVGLISPGTGWAAVAFGGRGGMEGANIIIGYVRNGDVTLEDHYGVSRTQHRRDRESSLLATGGTELHGETTLEFAIPLASGDPQDVDLVPGETISVFLARHESKNDLSIGLTCCGTTWIPLD